ncbi:hypothetical protein EV126DRAFT_417432 [Verticillium dahliae]|nr:hypothetical protein EV126DRAFT_417432 [Verticillium dahliae]
MFNTTKSLSSLKGVFPSIRQPLPLSRAESQKLLNALKTSFRSNLDREHGWGPDEPTLSPNKLSSPTVSEQSGIHQHHRPTDQHLRAILSNPLFKKGIRTTPRADALQKDPMEVFDKAVARGMMNRKAATGCLMAKHHQVLQSSPLSIQGAILESAAGLRVLDWLRSSGEERDGAFLGDASFLNALMRFLVAEGHEAVVWEWADRLARQDGPSIPEDPRGTHLSFILTSLIKTKANGSDDRNLNSAYATILRVNDRWKSDKNLPQLLSHAWRSLSWYSTVEAWNRPRPSEALFDNYVALEPELSHPMSIDRAHLDLHHPTHPSFERALHFFKTDKLVVPPQPSLVGAKRAPNVQRFIARITSMGMDTAKHLTEIGRTDDAQWVLQLLKSKLSDEAMDYERWRVV